MTYSVEKQLNWNYLEVSGWMLSLKIGKPVNYESLPVPWYTYPAIEFIEDKLKNDFKVFEYGSGQSTLWYSMRVFEVACVEHDSDFFHKIKGGFPKNVKATLEQEPSQYASEILKYKDGYFDVIAIDGINRNRCAELCYTKLKKKGFIILDNADREENDYAISLLLSKGFKRIDFYGLLPQVTYKKCTTIFFKEDDLLFRSGLPSQKKSCLGLSLGQLERESERRRRIVDKNSSSQDFINNKQVREEKICLFLTNYYPNFIKSHYTKHPNLFTESFQNQKMLILSELFGDADFYSECLKKAGWNSDDIIMNCDPLQQAWAKENNFSGAEIEVVVEQIRRTRPQVVYLHHLGYGTEEFLAAIRPHTELIVGQIAYPPFSQTDNAGFDIIFSSFPHFVERFRKQSITSYYQPLAFDPRVLERIGEKERIYPVTFVGGISSAHGKGMELLEKLAESVPIEFWGYGAESLPENSPIKKRHHGEAWGLDMFSVLSQSRITINRHIDVAENYANNMRLFEATGCGALLITDYKDNLNELFEIGKEVVAYRSPEECVAFVKYYLTHPDEAEKIAKAGQERTLKDHTYTKRMEKTAEILERHLRYKKGKDYLPLPERISDGYTVIQPSQISDNMMSAWKSEEIPAKQRALVQRELESMYKGKIPSVFQALRDCLSPYVFSECSVLEIGCASGYYYEILEYLLNKRIAYTGVDYSEPLIRMAKDYYPKAEFHVADGANLPFDNSHFSIAISSCVLLHVPNYKEHIRETVRVAKKIVVAHRTPVCRQRPTQYFKKMAYGVETCELCFNENEIVSEFLSHGLKYINGYQYYANPEQDKYEVTYIFEKSEKKAQDILIKPYSLKNKIGSRFKNGPVVLVAKPIAYTFPLSYAYLAGYLKEKGEDVRILFRHHDHQRLVEDIMKLNPVLVGFGNLYPELREIGNIIKLLDKAGREFPVVIGGQMVSPIPEFAVKVTGADFGVVGEGEITLHRLVSALRKGDDVSSVNGMVIRDKDKTFFTGAGDFIKDLSQLPPIPYDMFPQDEWLPIGLWYAENMPVPHWKVEDRVINVHGGRGCPFKCNFCYHHSKTRYRSIPAMIAEAAQTLERFKGNMLYFSDDLVLASPKRARELVRSLRELNKPIEYSISARFDILNRMDDALLYEMKETGCRIMGLGIESGSDRILKIIGKNCTAETILKGLERLKKVGILPTVSIMIGQYSETREDVELSIELMRQSVRVDPNINYAFTITTPFPGSPLYDLIFEKGLLRDDQEFYDRYFSTPGEWKQIVNLSQMSDQEVIEMHRKINAAYMEEKPKALFQKTVATMNISPDVFHKQYGVPFYIDKIMIDADQHLIIRCVSDTNSEQSSLLGYLLKGNLVSDALSWGFNAFPDIRGRYANRQSVTISEYSKPNFPHLTQDGKKLFRWYAVQ